MSTESKQVVLQVGDRRFTASIDVLVERSQYFEALFSGNWIVKKQDDGSIFLDGDGDAFEHVITYIRRGVFPLLFDPDKGHDHFLYFKILQEARYFQCCHLITWLENRCYTKCVIQAYEMGKKHGDIPSVILKEGDITNYKVRPLFTTDENIYICPRVIPEHEGHRERCGRRCNNAQGNDAVQYRTQRDVADWMVTKTRIHVEHEWMTDTGEKFVRYLEELQGTSDI